MSHMHQDKLWFKDPETNTDTKARGAGMVLSVVKRVKENSEAKDG